MFEIGVLSCQHISITLEHPYMEAMTTIELDLTCMPNIKCNIFSLGGDYSSITSGLSRILQTCISIPITVRTLIKYWERENSNKICGLDNSSLSLFCSQGKNSSGKSHSTSNKNCCRINVKQTFNLNLKCFCFRLKIKPANKVIKMECSDLEKDTNKNGTKHADLLDEQSQQVM